MNKHRRSGVTVIEVVIVFCIVLVLALIVLSRFNACVGDSVKDDATFSAQEWANFMYPNSEPRVQCVRLDSDGDGYVSCTIAHKEGDTIKVEAVECAAGIISINEGCRIPKLNTNMRNY
jgi:Tfp pilus assembly protein PilE